MEYLKERSLLLRIKECDLRRSMLEQCRNAADHGIHIGGAYSAATLLCALYYGGTFRYDAENPTCEEQDVFILSKGHAVAALAAVYADKGYFDGKHLINSRGWGALVKGHPGPAMPGVPVATGPLGHGIAIAAGYALRMAGRGGYDAYCMVGDGELQEGSCWEALLFAGDRRLSNLCVLVDRNHGQSDDTAALEVELGDLRAKFESFGFAVMETPADMAAVLRCLEQFAAHPRPAGPTAIICDTTKGAGGYSADMHKHKAVFSGEQIDREEAYLAETRALLARGLRHSDRAAVGALARGMGYRVSVDGTGDIVTVTDEPPPVRWKPAKAREKALRYDPSMLPSIKKGESLGTTAVGTAIARAFAADTRFYTIDSDLANASGLYAGTASVNARNAINAGIAECNMMCIAEALAACGCNVWTSTFGPFFDWRAFRRIAVSYQERSEAIADPDGWLGDGHNLDITFLSTASNLDTAVNGATHMSNDDICFFAQLAHVKLIDCSCPRQYVEIARWIAQGDRGLVYLRIMRNPAPALYGEDFRFEYGKGYWLKRPDGAAWAVVSSGHGVAEALGAAEDFPDVAVIDMPSYDGALLRELLDGGATLLFAEQNNGRLYDAFTRDVMANGPIPEFGRIHKLNTRDPQDRLRFIQSGTYEELVRELNLSAEKIARYIRQSRGGRGA